MRLFAVLAEIYSDKPREETLGKAMEVGVSSPAFRHILVRS